MNAVITSDTPPNAAPASSAWATLLEMKEAHWALLEEESPNTASNVRDFLTRGVALGRRLSLPAQRAEAQQLLDYWMASMRSLSDDEKGSSWSGCAILDQFDGAIVEAALASASSAFPPGDSAPDVEENTLLRRLVMQLVRLNDDGQTFTSAPQERERLLSSFAERELNEKILGKLLRTGMVTESGGLISLVDVSVLYLWDRARGWLDRRRELRSAARFWKGHSRDPGALLVSTDLIEEAESCRDRNELEDEFTFASRQRHGRNIRRVIGVLSTVIAVLVGLLGVTIYFAWKASVNEKEARKAKEQAEARFVEAVNARNAEKAANDSLPRKQNEAVAQEAKRNQDEIDKLRQRLEQQDIVLNAIQATGPPGPDSPPTTTGKPAWLEKAQSVIVADLAPSARAEIQQYALARAVENANLTPEMKKTLTDRGIRANYDFSPLQQPPPMPVENIPVCAGAGLIIKSGDDSEVFATAGVFVLTADNEKRMLLPGFLLTPGKRNRIEAANWQLAKPTRYLIAENVRRQPGDDDLVAVPASVNLAWNVIPVEKEGDPAVITAFREDPPPDGATVKMITQRAGMKRGKLDEVDLKNGLIYINYEEKEFQPGPGDAGAPILTDDNALVAVHIGRDSRYRAMARLTGTWMKRMGLRLVTASYSPQSTPAFRGAMIQFLVSSEDASLPEKTKPLLQAASARGLLIPDKAVLVRRRSPEITEVRYYYEDGPGGGDKPLADAITSWFDSKGIKCRTYRVTDPDAPRRMIQVALSLKDTQFLAGFAP